MTIETLVHTALHTAEADARMQAADAEFLFTFLSLKGEEKAARWRSLDAGAKFRLVARRLEQLGHDWMPSDVQVQIVRYDERYVAGPVDAAVEGALERLALEHAHAARLASGTGDKAGTTEERRQATAYTNALIQYRAGVRPEVLPGGARLIPSSTAGQPAHLLTMDGDWVCSCKAGASMHWPIALVIGLEGAHDDMQRYDDGDVSCDPPGEGPSLGDEEGDTLPSRRQFGQRLAQARAQCWATL